MDTKSSIGAYKNTTYSHLNHTLVLPEGVKMSFMLSNGESEPSNLIVLKEHEYFFIFTGGIFVKSTFLQESKTTRFDSNVEITDSGVNPNGIRILMLGDKTVNQIN